VISIFQEEEAVMNYRHDSADINSESILDTCL